MVIKTDVMTELKETLSTIAKENKNGVLFCKSKEVVGEIHFFSGKLAYAVIKKHRVRRWKRGLIKAKIEDKFDTISFSNEQPWEYELLHHQLGQKKIGMTQIKEAIRYVTDEAFFELLGYTDLQLQWQDKQKTQSGLVLVLALSGQEVSLILDSVVKLRTNWESLGLKAVSPSLAPLSKLDEPKQSLPLLAGLEGKLSIWDLAIKNKKTIIDLIQLLILYIRKGVVKFREIPDINSPNATPSAKVTRESSPVIESSPPPSTSKESTSKTKAVLIACIDDSPVVAHNIKKILTPAGYEILAIPEPMHGFSQLIQHQPSLILLDINMPNANGYSVCQFLRNSPVFEKTPIIILTGQDTNIDRARAKLVGATDFLAKPPDAKILLALIQKYLSL
ncbi:response regulator [Geminocystis herdmanii]|uniref:response regulator n=1 Tax=Geminocystis herdmanii TaxID=669359 RepID=UPI00034C1A98|nr:response regulator [Geminocystis herdmanii]